MSANWSPLPRCRPPCCAARRALCSFRCSTQAKKPIVVGDKKFTESIILAEMGVQLARSAGVSARREDLGGTPAVWLALTQGDIDAYVDYTGTIEREILQVQPADVAAALAARGVRMSKSLGFRNNYALAMRKDVAAAKGINKVSDISRPEFANLTCGFIPEFVDRSDGWPGLKRHYGLPQTRTSRRWSTPLHTRPSSRRPST